MTNKKKLYCKDCGDLILVIKQDIIPIAGMIFSKDHVEDNLGQAPWRNGELAICRKCSRPYWPINLDDLK